MRVFFALAAVVFAVQLFFAAVVYQDAAGAGLFWVGAVACMAGAVFWPARKRRVR